jgi:hypothetical protein
VSIGDPVTLKGATANPFTPSLTRVAFVLR